MNKRILSLTALSLIIGLPGVNAIAADQTQERQQIRTQDQVYGWQLMTPEERAEHRNKMRSMKTEQERKAFRMEHHKKMQERARQQNVSLPEEPLQQRKGRGRGGMGRGMGPGGGMGQGDGMGGGR